MFCRVGGLRWVACDLVWFAISLSFLGSWGWYNILFWCFGLFARALVPAVICWLGFVDWFCCGLVCFGFVGWGLWFGFLVADGFLDFGCSWWFWIVVDVLVVDWLHLFDLVFLNL